MISVDIFIVDIVMYCICNKACSITSSNGKKGKVRPIQAAKGLEGE
jgi:hypothetical protein